MATPDYDERDGGRESPAAREPPVADDESDEEGCLPAAVAPPLDGRRTHSRSPTPSRY